ncbi:MAG: isoprenylcysteine carboxylmethyltransferase family protein [Candidatus Methanoperedens sp.]|nr:isoprenylcysteine carboxylmethyltransferase family protein [Candidatus Methanoperedens sp.]
MDKLGNIIFKYRNVIFPIFFALLLFRTMPAFDWEHFEKWGYPIGLAVALTGQTIRALTIGLVYIIRGGRKRKVYAETLVKTGMFAHCRNPLYLGNILIVTGLGIFANSILFYYIGIPLFIFMYMAIIVAEENYLTGKFGEEYIEYCRNVNRFMPNLSGIRETIGSMTFHWRRLIVKEYGTTYMWIICMILLILKNQYLRYGHEVNKTVILILSLLSFFVTLLYAVARYLKKSRRLTAD